MGNTKKEKLIFTTLMCAGMVICMSMYNIWLLEGFSSTFFKHFIAGLIPGFLVALLLDLFVAGPVARFLLHKFTGEQTKPVKKMLTMIFSMVAMMVLLMSLYGVLVNAGATAAFTQLYVNTVWKNAVFAFPLQLIIIGPLVRSICSRLFAQSSRTAA
ncbi:DUF2798 domain-containing protein [Domibacillus indicus]|uniref:DUF2798 domain-containing protein n=1 Tax=Domibacillus indicus TaxID=1437523 RepID=UPI00061813EB|nr:DUF2798 domain-containing protein [Domibacillus indicus]